MTIWTGEIKELEILYNSFKGNLPELEKELEQLIRTQDANVVMLYSRRCLEVIITDLCENELKRPRKTEPLKGIIDKLKSEDKVPSHIITSMDHLNSLSSYGTHPKDFDTRQVKPVLNNLAIIIEWHLKHKSIKADKTTEGKVFDSNINTVDKDYFISDSLINPEKSIIVLPFENISSDPDQEYFSDGLTEEIITDLSHIHDLIVISRSSAMTFKGTKKKIGEIAKEVNVHYVLEGSVRKAGNNLRITAQLIDGINDSHIWADKYSGTLDDIFDIQEKVSQSITNALKIKLSSEEKKKIEERPVDNVLAYDFYLKARQGFWAWDQGALNRSSQLLENGLKIAGENEFIYAGLGFVNWQMFNYGSVPEYSLLEKTKEYANKIFKIDNNSPLGFRLLGFVSMFKESLQMAAVYFKKVLDVTPNDSEVLVFYAMCLLYSGKIEEARIIINRLLKIDPLTWLNHLAFSFLFIMEGDYSRALEQTEKMYLIESDNPYIKYIYAYHLGYVKNYKKSYKLFDEIGTEGKVSFLSSLSNFVKYAFQNEKEKALIAVSPELKKKSENDFELAWQMAECYAMINEKQLSLDCIENAVNRGVINYPFYAEKNPYLNSIRGEERFNKIMDRVKREWENFEI
jgi:TolB-like protein